MFSEKSQHEHTTKKLEAKTLGADLSGSHEIPLAREESKRYCTEGSRRRATVLKGQRQH
jgi:hypothetical protein